MSDERMSKFPALVITCPYNVRLKVIASPYNARLKVITCPYNVRLKVITCPCSVRQKVILLLEGRRLSGVGIAAK